MTLTRLLRAVSRRRKNAFNACMHPINCQVQANKKPVRVLSYTVEVKSVMSRRNHNVTFILSN